MAITAIESIKVKLSNITGSEKLIDADRSRTGALKWPEDAPVSR